MRTAGGKLKTVRVRINSTIADVEQGATILEAAKAIGIDIPALCNHPMISHSGACRVCIVEVNGNPTTSCTTLVEEDMEIVTNSPYIEDLRRDTIDLIRYPHDGAGQTGRQPVIFLDRGKTYAPTDHIAA